MTPEELEIKIEQTMRSVYPNPQDYTKWLTKPNQFLDDLSPIECIEQGKQVELFTFINMCIIE